MPTRGSGEIVRPSLSPQLVPKDARLCQLRESHSEYLQMMSSEECPLLSELAPRMLHDLGWEKRACSPSVMQDLWQELSESALWTRSGTRLTMNRFMQAIRISESEDSLWTQRLHCQLFCCLNEGMLTGEACKKQFEKVVAPRVHEDGEEKVPSA